MRMVLLACGRTDELLSRGDEIDIESLRSLGACSIYTRDVIATVGCELADDQPHMVIATVDNLVVYPIALTLGVK